jgi:hypothetical protein
MLMNLKQVSIWLPRRLWGMLSEMVVSLGTHASLGEKEGRGSFSWSKTVHDDSAVT